MIFVDHCQSGRVRVTRAPVPNRFVLSLKTTDIEQTIREVSLVFDGETFQALGAEICRLAATPRGRIDRPAIAEHEAIQAAEGLTQ